MNSVGITDVDDQMVDDAHKYLQQHKIMVLACLMGEYHLDIVLEP